MLGFISWDYALSTQNVGWLSCGKNAHDVTYHACTIKVKLLPFQILMSFFLLRIVTYFKSKLASPALRGFRIRPFHDIFHIILETRVKWCFDNIGKEGSDFQK